LYVVVVLFRRKVGSASSQAQASMLARPQGKK